MMMIIVLNIMLISLWGNVVVIQRAHSIFSRFLNSERLEDIPTSVHIADRTSVLDVLFEINEPPAFIRKDRSDSIAVADSHAAVV